MDSAVELSGRSQISGVADSLTIKTLENLILAFKSEPDGEFKHEFKLELEEIRQSVDRLMIEIKLKILRAKQPDF